VAFTKNVLTQDWWDGRIQVGQVSLMNQTSQVVTFPNSFANVPKVFFTLLANSGKHFWVSGVSTTQFTINAHQNETIDINWMAIDR